MCEHHRIQPRHLQPVMIPVQGLRLAAPLEEARIHQHPGPRGLQQIGRPRDLPARRPQDRHPHDASRSGSSLATTRPRQSVATDRPFRRHMWNGEFTERLAVLRTS